MAKSNTNKHLVTTVAVAAITVYALSRSGVLSAAKK
jgi:hypothetical protein